MSDFDWDHLGPRVAAHVLWYFGMPGGEEPGGFVKALLMAFQAADPDNRARLSSAFPGHGVAMALADTVDGGRGLQHLQALAAEREQEGTS